jgi:hypothetical protein
MAIEILVARMFAILYLVIGIAGVMDKKYFLNMTNEIMKNPGLRFTWAMFAFVAGFLIISYHNVWTGWPIIVTLIGWIGLIKGIMILLFPKMLEKKANMVFKGVLAGAMPYICIILGLIVGYFGFLA